MSVSNPNSNAQEASVHLADDPASGGAQAADSHISEGVNPSGESGSMPGAEALSGESANSDVPDALGTNAVIEVALIGTGELIEDNDLHSAVVSMTGDALLSVDYTLDHLISSTDLFDVPAFDFSEDSST